MTVLHFSSYKMKYIVILNVPNARFCFPACTAYHGIMNKLCKAMPQCFCFYHLPHCVQDLVVLVIFLELCVKVLKDII